MISMKKRGEITLCALLTAVFVCLLTGVSLSGQVEDILSLMTPHQKVCQLFMPGIKGPELDEDTRKILEEYPLGGFIFFGGRNVAGQSQTVKFTRQLQQAASGTGAGVPLFFSIDQEGGVGSHINILTGGVDTVGNMALGASTDPHDTYLSYKIMADDLRAYGIHIDLAPVLDLMLDKDNTMNHIRSLGDDPEAVSQRAVQAVLGLQDNGIIATIKHFPGKGPTPVDSHKNAPVTNGSVEYIRSTVSPAFEAAIAAGADAVMINHEHYPALDPENIATVSGPIITGYLRGTLGFDGLVISDSITMGGVREKFDPAAAAYLFIKAGGDMVLFAGDNPNEYIDAIKRVEKALEDGDLTMAQVDNAVLRVLRAKDKYGVLADTQPTPADVYKDLKRKNYELSLEIARRTITFVKNDNNILPLDPDRAERVLVISPRAYFTVPMIGSGFPIGVTLGAKIREVAPRVKVMEYDYVTIRNDIKRALEKAADADVIVFGSILAYYSPEYVDFVKQLQATGRKIVVVGMSVPWDLDRFGDIDAFVAAYNPRSVSLIAAAEALFGKITPQGRVPVKM